MKTKVNSRFGTMLAGFILLLQGLLVRADLSVKELRALIESGEKVTIVDIRQPSRFAGGHIPNALNIPATVIDEKRLPPLGRVAVCAEGLGLDDPRAAVEALNRKPGIRAEILVGGYRAWRAVGAPTTEKPGFNPAVEDVITYAELKAAGDEVVLVDLRVRSKARKESLPPAATALTDLSLEFPGRRVVRDPFGVPTGEKQAAAEGALPPLLVLIDSGDGRAEKAYRALRANGRSRVVILAGGEAILQRRGRAGSQRVGQGVRTVGGDGPSAAGGGR